MSVGYSIDILHNSHILLSSIICAPHISKFQVECSFLFYQLETERLVRIGTNKGVHLKERNLCVILRTQMKIEAEILYGLVRKNNKLTMK